MERRWLLSIAATRTDGAAQIGERAPAGAENGGGGREPGEDSGGFVGEIGERGAEGLTSRARIWGSRARRARDPGSGDGERGGEEDFGGRRAGGSRVSQWERRGETREGARVTGRRERGA